MDPQSLDYCDPCARQTLATWKGWPHRDAVPELPRLIGGRCEACAQVTATLNSSLIRWRNCHNSDGGPPDWWLLEVDDDVMNWGRPYHAEMQCPRCNESAVVSEFRTEMRMNCPDCGVRRLPTRDQVPRKVAVRQAVALKARLKQNEVALSQSARIRIHRAISWFGRAESEVLDHDAKFIFLWIAFNAAYAREFGFEHAERDVLRESLATLLAVDESRRLHCCIFQRFSGPVRLLIDNPYVFEPFWRALRTHDSSERWKSQFEASQRAALRSVMGQDTLVVLSIIFDRLYVLRNQLVHGGATWNGRVNRPQIRDGSRLLQALVPIIIELMIDHPELDPGEIMYPVVER